MPALVPGPLGLNGKRRRSASQERHNEDSDEEPSGWLWELRQKRIAERREEVEWELEILSY